jgi:hypothetical protein
MKMFGTVVLTALVVQANAPTTPDFTGAWKIDAARGTSTGGGRGGGRGTGGGLGLGPSADELTIRQDTRTLTIDERHGTDTTRVTYGLDGRPVSNTLGAGRSAGASAVYVSQWKDGRLTTTITIPAAAGTEAKTQYQQLRYLDRDGSMVVETTIPGQENARKVVYVKPRTD